MSRRERDTFPAYQANDGAWQQQWWASPVGQATQARQRGDGFFQIELPHSVVQARTNWRALDQNVRADVQQAPPRTDLLSQIEAAGWRLEHVNFVWVQTGAMTRERVFMPGTTSAVAGEVIGVYLFRAVPTPAP